MIYLYVIFINLFGFILMGTDKYKATKRRWRTPEKVLWGTAIVGGAVGMLVGMQVFHHKTKHRDFQIGITFLVFLQIACSFYLWLYGKL